MPKLCHIDVETTGLWENKHAIVQLGATIEIEGEVVDTIELLMAPFEGALIDDKALDHNKRTREEIAKYPNPATQFVKFKSLIEKHLDPSNPKDKFVFVAYNAPFDTQFVRAFTKRHGGWKAYTNLFHVPSICTMALAGTLLMEELGNMENFQLGTVAKRLGIKPTGDLHDALVDVELSRQIFHKCTE